MVAQSSGYYAIDVLSVWLYVHSTYIQRTQITSQIRAHKIGKLGQSTVHSRVQTTSQTGGTGALSNVHTDNTDNQIDRGHTLWGTVGHSGAVNCTYRGHR